MHMTANTINSVYIVHHIHKVPLYAQTLFARAVPLYAQTLTNHCPEKFWAYRVSQDPSDSKSRLAVDSCPIYTRSRGQGLRESRAPIG